MQVDCASSEAVAQVRAVLIHYGVTEVLEQGPHLNTTDGVIVVVNEAIRSDQELAMRREIQRITGATIID